jgi:hypothetical protein
MYGWLQLFRAVPQTKEANIHIHSEFTSVNLYKAGLSGLESLRSRAIRISVETKNYRVMSNYFMSIMLVNLYSDHWFVLAIYPRDKRIDCLNWFPTSDATVKLLCRLLHVYLWAHSLSDNNFLFTAGEWSFCVIAHGRITTQLNGFDCGAIAIRTIEYLIAGGNLVFTQATMPNYRRKILLALRLGRIPWLETPHHQLSVEDTKKALAQPVARVAPQAEDAETTKNRREAREARRELTSLFEQRGADGMEQEQDWINQY